MESSLGNPFKQISADLSSKAAEIISQAIQDGSLLKGRFIERQQVTFRSIRRMLITDFNLFLKKPSAPSPFHSKNLMIVHLVVLLQSCLNARVGDIVQSRGYTADEFMKWNDVELSFRTDAGVRESSRGPGLQLLHL